MKVFVIFASLCIGLIGAYETLYTGYKVYRLTPTSQANVETIAELENYGFDFWCGPNGKIGMHSDVLFPPDKQGDFLQGLKEMGIQVEEFMSDVQRMIEEESRNSVKEGRMDWVSYHRYDEISQWMHEVAAEHSDIASIFTLGVSYENRTIYGLKISRNTEEKPAIFIDSNIHAREWATSAVVTFTINEILNNPDMASWTEDFEWYIVPVLNPDGFEYSHTNDRMWRKTRSKTSSPLGCKGVDANRNNDYYWKANGPPSLSDPCSAVYAGPTPFSEPETLAMSQFLTDIKDRLVFYTSVHTYGQWILIPFGHENAKIPQYDTYMRIGQAAARGHAERYGTEYVPGNVVDLLYIAPGETFDWVKGVLDVDLTFIYELRDKGQYGFLLPAEQIIPSSLEFIDGLAVIVDELRVGIPRP